MNAVREVVASDADSLATVLGRAFADDPVWCPVAERVAKSR
jgi:hypothetical protein